MHHQGGAWRAALATVFTTGILLGPTAVAASASAATLPTANVTVNAVSPIGTIPATAFGLNTAVWDSHLQDAAIPGLLKKLDVGVLRFPGGSTSDDYDWENNTIVPGQSGGVDPSNTFDNFMKVAQNVGAQPIITVNYGSNFAGTAGGDPTEAAAWVKYANVTHDYGVEYWEIGNEVYGNGTYSSPGWETDLHKHTGPQAYADNALTYITDMKAVDPSIKVGVVLTDPFNWPWGQSPNWNEAVLKTDGSAADFVIVHWYAQNPGNETDAGLLASTQQIPAMVARLRQEISEYAGSAAANRIQIFVTETNSVSYNPGKQTTSLVNALFLDNDFMDWLQAGVANVDWWDLHNSAYAGNASSTLYGDTTYGDYGILSNGSSAAGVSEPPANTPFPSYYGYEMLTHLGQPGDTMVTATSDQSLVSVHAVKQANGNLAVMLVNKDPNQSYDVNLNLEGYAPSPSATEYVYGENSSGITSSTIQNTAQPVTIAPYSVTTLVMTPRPVQPANVALSQSTSVGEPSIPAGASQSLSTTVSDVSGALADGTIEVDVVNSAGQVVGQKTESGVDLSPGGTATVKWSFSPTAQDTYTVRVFVFEHDGSQTDLAAPDAGSFVATVAAAPTFSTTTTVSPQDAAPGQAVTITSTLTNTSSDGILSNGIFDMELHDSSNNQVAQHFVTESLNPGQSVTETWNVTAPSTPGTYSVQLGAFSAGWATNYYWDATAGTLTVTTGGAGDMPELPFAGIIPLALAASGTVLLRRKRR